MEGVILEVRHVPILRGTQRSQKLFIEAQARPLSQGLGPAPHFLEPPTYALMTHCNQILLGDQTR